MVPPSRMPFDNDWLTKRTKSVLVDKSIVITGSNMSSIADQSITLTVKAIELNYGPVISFSVTVDKPCNNQYNWGDWRYDWDDHPFMYIDPEGSPYEIGNIVEDTPAIRALIEELVAEPKNMYTTTDCTHRGRLLKAIMSFFS